MKEHYFSEKQTSYFELKTIQVVIRGKEYIFNTAPGVFSASKLDFGTKLLAEKMLIKENDKVLDLGCGIGIIGRIAATLTQNKVILTDVNQRACKLAKMNTKGLKNTKVKPGNIFIRDLRWFLCCRGLCVLTERGVLASDPSLIPLRAVLRFLRVFILWSGTLVLILLVCICM